MEHIPTMGIHYHAAVIQTQTPRRQTTVDFEGGGILFISSGRYLKNV